MGSAQSPREEILGGQRVRAPAQCPSFPVSCWRPSWSKTGDFHCELLEVFRCSDVPKFGDSSYLKPPECHSCSHPLRKKRNSPPKQMCGFAAAEEPLPPLSVYPDALGQTTGHLFLVTRLDSRTLNNIKRPCPSGPELLPESVLSNIEEKYKEHECRLVCSSNLR